MRIRPFGKQSVVAPTAGQAADFDRMAVSEQGVPEVVLMENAGRQAAFIIQHCFPEGRIMALVGKGNNGGDALVALRTLAAWGRKVTAIIVGERPLPDPLLHGWEIPTMTCDAKGVSHLNRVVGQARVVIDGLLGTGIKGEPKGVYAAAITALNKSGDFAVVAMDTPSGVDATTGEVPSEAVWSNLTVAFGWPKLGTLLQPGRGRSGRIVAVEIGFPPWKGEWAKVITPGWTAATLPERPAVTHKGEVGSVTLVAGSAMTGAAILAARAAFRSGAGLLRVCAAESARTPLLAAVPEAIFVDADDPEAVTAAVHASDALAAGPGMGTDERASLHLDVALSARGDRPAVLDADALTVLASSGALSPAGATGIATDGIIITPHPGEMARLIDSDVSEVQNNRLGVVREFAARGGVVTVLKGSPTLVADPEGGLMLSSLEINSSLATAGSGDVLTGSIVAFLAQGVQPLDAAGLGLGVTGLAVCQLGLGPSLASSDIVEQIPTAMNWKGDGETDLPFPFVTFDQRPPF